MNFGDSHLSFWSMLVAVVPCDLFHKLMRFKMECAYLRYYGQLIVLKRLEFSLMKHELTHTFHGCYASPLTFCDFFSPLTVFYHLSHYVTCFCCRVRTCCHQTEAAC